MKVEPKCLWLWFWLYKIFSHLIVAVALNSSRYACTLHVCTTYIIGRFDRRFSNFGVYIKARRRNNVLMTFFVARLWIAFSEITLWHFKRTYYTSAHVAQEALQHAYMKITSVSRMHLKRCANDVHSTAPYAYTYSYNVSRYFPFFRIICSLSVSNFH